MRGKRQLEQEKGRGPTQDALNDACVHMWQQVPSYHAPASVRIHTEEVNPDVNNRPTGQPSVYLQDGKAWVYSPEGKCTTTLPTAALRQ